jgi:hypothetical protein
MLKYGVCKLDLPAGTRNGKWDISASIALWEKAGPFCKTAGADLAIALWVWCPYKGGHGCPFWATRIIAAAAVSIFWGPVTFTPVVT